MNPTFLVTSKRLNMLGSTFFVVCSLVNRSFRLFFAVSLVIPSTASMLFRFILEKHHSLFSFSFLTSVNFFYSWVWGFWTLNTYTLPSLLVDSVQNLNCHLSLSILSYQTFRCVRQSLSHAFPPLKTSRLLRLLHFNLEKHHSYFSFNFMTFDYLS